MFGSEIVVAQRSLTGLRRRGSCEEQFHAGSLRAGQVRRDLSHLVRRFCQIAAERVLIPLNEVLYRLGRYAMDRGHEVGELLRERGWIASRVVKQPCAGKPSVHDET